MRDCLKPAQWIAFMGTLISSCILVVVFVFSTFETKIDAKEKQLSEEKSFDLLRKDLRETRQEVRQSYRDLDQKLDHIINMRTK